MNALDTIAELTRRGVELWVEGEHLRVRAARGTLTSELQGFIVRHKMEMIELLRKRNAPPPQLIAAPEEQHDPFPLTDIQQAYLVGRTGAFGIDEIACHLYHEFESPDIDVARLSSAWQRLIGQHAMLRSVVLPDGGQKVLDLVPPFSIPVLDLRGQEPASIERELARIRGELSTRVSNPGQWPSFDIRATLLDGRTRIHFDFDLITADASGMLMLLEEWRDLTLNPDRPLRPVGVAFRDYVKAELSMRSTAGYLRAEAYWRARVPHLPPAPLLPLAQAPERLVRPPFRRLSSCIEVARWSSLKQRATEAGLTPSGLVCAAFAEILAAWSENARFTLNLTLFRRLPLHPEVDRLLGDFTTTVLLEVDRRGASFTERACFLRDQLARDLEHTEVSGVTVLREMTRQQDTAAIMPVVFTSLLGHRTRAATGEPLMAWLGEIVHSISQTPQVWLDHQVREDAGALVYSWDSPEGLFPEGLLEDAFAAYGALLLRLADDDAVWRDSSVVPLPPHQRARRDANLATAPVPAARLDELYLAQVEKGPERTAILAEDRSLGYAELLGHAEALAQALRAAGAQPDTLIAIVMNKGWKQVVAALAIHLAGAAYLPIDPALPEARRALLIEEGRVAVVVTDPGLSRQISFAADVLVIAVDDAPAARPAGALPRQPRRTSADLAYCIYTSGSTGRPKGVMIEHRAAANTILDINRRFEVGAGDRVLALSSLGFDLSVYDIFGSLAAGAAIIMPEPAAARDPQRWLELAREHKATIWNSVPMLMEMLVDLVEGRKERLPDSLRLVLLSGDWIPVSLPARIRRLSTDVRIISLGGATEAAIWSILHPIDDVGLSTRSIPYGRAMLNQRFHVLDDALSPRPDHVPGELFIGGAGLARSYWRDEQTTRERFLDHPRTGERLYRTGDMGRFLPDGNIEFLGRKDFQVKVAGHRIELGEIEAALLRHPAIREAVVAAPGERTRRKLVAYVVSAEEHGPPPPDEALRDFLRTLLPEYMVPGVYVRMPRLPLSANGKIDRNALPEPAAQSPAGEGVPDASGGEILATVSRLVCGVLKLNEVHPEQRLLQLGATSVELIQLATRLHGELGSRPRMAEFIKLRTVSEIAAYYLARQPAKGSAAKGPDQGDVVEQSLILTVEAREAFKRAHHGFRRFEAGEPAHALATVSGDVARRRCVERTSHRTFSTEPVDAGPLGRLLECLQPIEIDGELKYQYGSAGGSYAVQVYVQVRPGRVQGLSEGGYGYDPARHRLVRLSAPGLVDGDVHTPANRQVAERSAFSIFLVCDRAAIVPLYGEKWRDFALIEAGLMAQLLEMRAAEENLGLCQIGEVRFDELRALFRLEERHVHLHSLLGGGLVWEEGSI